MKKHIESDIEKIERERILLSQNLNPECEYVEVCECCFRGCSIGNKKDCNSWRDWTIVDLRILFEREMDKNGNYFLDFDGKERLKY